MLITRKPLRLAAPLQFAQGVLATGIDSAADREAPRNITLVIKPADKTTTYWFDGAAGGSFAGVFAERAFGLSSSVAESPADEP